MINSGVKWIGEIPNDWTVSKIGAEFKPRNTKVSDKDYMPLSVTKLPEGILPQMDQVAKSDAHDDRKLVVKGDFVINSRSDRKMSCGVSNYDGSVSLINIVMQPIGDVTPEYSHYILKNYSFAEEFYRWGHGIVADLWTTTVSDMKNISIPVPPKDVQLKIVETIKEKEEKINQLIANQEKQIEKLKEYKQSLITEVVTKGLNPNTTMKNSGVEWIQKIPETWITYYLKRLFSFSKGLPITKENLKESGIKVISYGQIHAKYNKTVITDEALFRYVDSEYLNTNKSSLVNIDDFIFADTSEDLLGVGDCVRINKTGKIFAGYHSIILKAIEPKSSHYLSYLFLTDNWRTQFRKRVNGVKLFSITQKILASGEVIIPPMEEQKAIVTFLDKKCKSIDSLINIKLNKIDRLNSYKKSLIYEYVTGKRN